jgi:polar amino acid transport system substrate-binding protein
MVSIYIDKEKKMKKRIVSLVLACVMFTMAGAALYAGGSSASGKAKAYTIATDTTFAPFEFQDAQSNYVGIDIELLAAIAADQGFNYDLKPLGFSAAVAALESSQCDGVIAGMSITEERKLKYDFSRPYYDSGVVMAIRADNNEIRGYADLKGKRVAVKTGTEGATFAESIKETSGFTLVYFDESPFMYEEVKAGNSVACFEDYPVMGYGISQGNGLKMVTSMEQGSSYGFAVLKGKNQDLLKAFDSGLANIRSSGKYQQILDKYISTK